MDVPAAVGEESTLDLEEPPLAFQFDPALPAGRKPPEFAPVAGLPLLLAFPVPARKPPQ
jgi:hypothetical protein